MKKVLLFFLACFPMIGQLVNFAPTNMTSNTAPTPYVVTQTSSFSSANNGFAMFSSNGPSSANYVSSGGSANTVTIDFGSGTSNTILAYSISLSIQYATRGPTAWTFGGSNDGSSWTTLDTESGVVWGIPCNSSCLTYQTKYFLVSGAAAYRYFEIVVSTTAGASYLQINNMAFYGGSYVAPTVTGGIVGNVAMSSQNSAFPIVTDTTSQFTGILAGASWNIFPGNGDWISDEGAPTGTVYIDFLYPTGETLGSYSVTAGNAATNNRSPKNWTLAGSSNNGVSWTTLDTETNQTGWTTSGQTRTFTITGASAYSKFRFQVTANNGDGSYVQMQQLTLYVRSAFPTSVGAFTVGP